MWYALNQAGQIQFQNVVPHKGDLDEAITMSLVFDINVKFILQLK